MVWGQIRGGGQEGTLGRTAENSTEDAFVLAYERLMVADLLAFYELARVAARADREDLFARLTARTGLARHTLQSYALVGKHIPPHEMPALAAYRDENGEALGRRRLIALAVKERLRRRSLVEAVLSAGPSDVKPRESL